MGIFQKIQRLFGKQKKASIDWVTFDSFGWKLTKNTEEIQQWQSPDFPALLSNNFFSSKPDIPKIGNLDALRLYYREKLKSVDGGLIAVEKVNLKDLEVIETIFKIPNANGGTIYLGSYTIPFERCSFVIKVQAQEIEMTGKRNSYVLNHFVQQGTVKYTKEGLKGWSVDPYDETIKEGLLMNLSERPEYDLMFREHPLSKVREILYAIKKSIDFNSVLKEFRIHK